MTSWVVFLGLLQAVAGQQEEVAPLAPVAPVAPSFPVAPGVVPVAPGPVMPAVPSTCINYMASVGCQWTAQWNCPGQVPYGSSGQAAVDSSHGYMCCCVKELWKYVTPVVTPAPSVVPTPPVHWKQGFTLEGIPHYIYHQKYPLMRWFEDNSMCPLNDYGGFPAWIGYKSVLAAGGAITTPKQGLAGNRTLQVRGFCPKVASSGFECVEEGNELKARVVGYSNITISLDGLNCELRDISLFKTSPDNFMGIRLDFATCVGDIDLGVQSRHVPKTAAIRMGVREKQPEDAESNLANFFKAVCNGAAPASIYTAELPKFVYPRKPGLDPRAQPVCMAHSANALHVMGKSCFEDFLVMDWLAPPPTDPITGFPVFSSDPVLASIPTEDYQALKNMIPAYQPKYHPKVAAQLIHTATTPAPTPAPTPAATFAPDICGPSYVCQPGTHRIPGTHLKVCSGAFCQPAECCQATRRLEAPSRELFKSRKLFWGMGTKATTTGNPCAPQTPPGTTEGPFATCACSKGGVSGPSFCNPYQCPPGYSLRPMAVDVPCESRSGCTKKDLKRCCALQTTTTTTVGEVPGVIIADRLCIQLSLCACDNDCDCVAKAPNSVVTLPPPLPPVQYCLDFFWEILLIGLFAFFPMVLISTCALKTWGINEAYTPDGGQEGYGYPGMNKAAKETYNDSTMQHALNGLTQYTSIGTHNPHLHTETNPLHSYMEHNKTGKHEKTGVSKALTQENSYLRLGLFPTLFVNLFVILVIGFFCIALAYWPVSWIMVAVMPSSYVFPICLPFLPICPSGQLWPECGATGTTWLYNPDCVCSTSLYSLGVALGMTCWWGHWWFWISKRVIYNQIESTTTAAMVYTELEQSGVNQNAPINAGGFGPVRWMRHYLYGN